MRIFWSIAVLLIAVSPALQARAAVSLPEDKYSAVVLAYHTVGEDAYPDRNIRADQFLAHIDEITKDGYTVLKLADIIDAVQTHKELPPRALAITFEGAYKSILKEAVPALLAKKIPFTVFYSSGQADSNAGEYMGWDDLKALSKNEGVTLGILPASYSRLINQPEGEIRAQVNKALQRHREMFSAEPQFFSYPFGEYSLAYKKIISGMGFKAAFGLQSGTIYEGEDLFILPRFTMTERYGDLDRFRLVANALPLPVSEVEPKEPQLGADSPNIGFSLPASLFADIHGLSCFISGEEEPDLHIIGNRAEIRLKNPPGDERVRLNCTIPGPPDAETDAEQWRWMGMLLTGQSAGTPADDAETMTNNPPPDEPQ